MQESHTTVRGACIVTCFSKRMPCLLHGVGWYLSLPNVGIGVKRQGLEVHLAYW
jgi:hypothetical protein